MANLKKEDKIRLTFDVPKDTYDNIERLCDRIRCQTKAELFRNALSLFDFLVENIDKGSKVILKNKSGEKEIVFPFLKK